MSKLEDRYEAAAAEFVKAKAAKDRSVYTRAKNKMIAARTAWRAERDQSPLSDGAVRPPAVKSRAAVKKNG